MEEKRDEKGNNLNKKKKKMDRLTQNYKDIKYVVTKIQYPFMI